MGLNPGADAPNWHFPSAIQRTEIPPAAALFGTVRVGRSPRPAPPARRPPAQGIDLQRLVVAARFGYNLIASYALLGKKWAFAHFFFGERRLKRLTETTKLNPRSAVHPAVKPGPNRPAGRLDSALLTELAEVAKGAGCELVHAELKGNVLRLFIDREGSEGEGGVTHADCEHVSRQASALLDVADFGKGRYILEVSSPGLDRQLYGPRDYARFTGKLVRVTFENPAAGVRKRTVVGRLREYRPGAPSADPGRIAGEIEVAEERSGEVLAIPLADIKMARLEIEL
jgi:ribosome maturation factor RimP